MIKNAFRYFMILVSVVQAVFAIAFYWQWPILTDFWPLEGTTPLTFIFISSIAAAAAASTFWAAASGHIGAMVGIGLDYIVILAPVSILFFILGAQTDSLPLFIGGVVSVFGALFGAFLCVYSARFPLDNRKPVPAPVRISFIIFIIALLIVSTGLILKMPNIIPWKLTPELSVIMGWMFLGAAAYFIYALLKPAWSNAAGQLIGFLAYDLVLIVPFINRLPNTPPEQMPGLVVYTAVVVYSGLLAIYYLFIHKQTRLFVSQP